MIYFRTMEIYKLKDIEFSKSMLIESLHENYKTDDKLIETMLWYSRSSYALLAYLQML